MYDTDKTRRGNQPALSHALALNISYVVQQSIFFPGSAPGQLSYENNRVYGAETELIVAVVWP